LSSRAQPRDLQFRGPLLEMFFSTESTRISCHVALDKATCGGGTCLRQPVLRKPAEIPLMVAESARLMASELSPARLRLSRSTWIKLMGST
jgi:hypothetical protein